MKLNNKDQSSNKRQKVFFLIFCLIILINPFPLGSNRLWAWSFQAMIASSLLMLMVSCSLFSNHCVNWSKLKKMKIELVLIGMWFVVNALYLIPMPISLLQFLSPTIAIAYADLDLSHGYLSLDVSASYQTLMLLSLIHI